jgi:hypothetical protein
VNMSKILQNNILFSHSQILTKFHHQNILLFNQKKQFVVIHVLVPSLDVVMIFMRVIDLIKILIVINIFLIHIQLKQEKKI